MARRKTKQKRHHRKPGEPLGSLISTKRVLYALSNAFDISESDFIEAFDKYRPERKRSTRSVNPERVEAFQRYQEDGDFEAFREATGLSESGAMSAIGRMTVTLPSGDLNS